MIDSDVRKILRSLRRANKYIRYADYAHRMVQRDDRLSAQEKEQLRGLYKTIAEDSERHPEVQLKSLPKDSEGKVTIKVATHHLRSMRKETNALEGYLERFVNWSHEMSNGIDLFTVVNKLIKLAKRIAHRSRGNRAISEKFREL